MNYKTKKSIMNYNTKPKLKYNPLNYIKLDYSV